MPDLSPELPSSWRSPSARPSHLFHPAIKPKVKYLLNNAIKPAAHYGIYLAINYGLSRGGDENYCVLGMNPFSRNQSCYLPGRTKYRLQLPGDPRQDEQLPGPFLLCLYPHPRPRRGMSSPLLPKAPKAQPQGILGRQGATSKGAGGRLHPLSGLSSQTWSSHAAQRACLVHSGESPG